ncbi:Ig-like domain-containing protein [Chitinophaga agri]|uniref:T9SS type B sorting domain-containing protein n=1 Tax=Chitinophaga agri TaxID=2703787 RepID=A0A6B9ZDI4_9BACT|nr:Ig-like domain-containing protein [Chitinophaga agri]QHS59819.1 T9SS type B sorting domain-containing protein [Chitinophaga agri]
MSDTFTKCINRLLLVLFFIVSGVTGYAQYNKSALETGYYYTGIARNQNGDLFAVRSNASGKYDVVKYAGGAGAGNIIYQNIDVDPPTAPYGIAVNSGGDVFVTSMNSAVTGWEVVKLTYPSYAPTKILGNNGKYITGLAIDNNDDLLTLEYEGGRYTVRRYPHGNENSAGTTVYATGVPLGAPPYPSAIAVDSRNNIYFADFPAEARGIIKVKAPFYTTDSIIANGRAFSGLAIDNFDRIYATEIVSSTASSIIRWNDSSFTTATSVYTNLHNSPGSYPGGVQPMASGKIFATDGVDQEIVQLTPQTTQIMQVKGLTANPTAANSLSFEVVYSAAPSGIGVGSFSLTTTGVTGASISSIAPTAEANKYNVYVATGNNSGTIRLNANATGITPTVTNAPMSSATYTIDKDAPSGSFTINGGAGYTNNPNIVLALTASDVTTSVNRMSFSIDGGSYTTNETFATSKNLTIPATSASHTVDVRFIDEAGNALQVSRNIVYDDVPPATPVITANPAALTTSGNATFTFTGESGATFEALLDGGAYAAATSPRTYTGLADGSHTFSVRAVDQAGNLSTTPATYTWTVDATAPAVSSVSVPANGYYRAGMDMDFKVKFSEVVNVTNAAGNPYINIIIGLTTVQVPYISGTGTDELTFRYTVQAGENDADGIAVQPDLRLNSGAIRDAAGNGYAGVQTMPLAGVASTTAVRVNTSIPSVTLSSAANAILNAPFSITVTFSEAVTGLVAADFTLTNATAGAPATSDNITYTILVTPTAQGAVSVSLPAGTVVNIGGNPNTASNTINRTFDNIAPTVTSVDVPANGYYNAGKNLDFTVNFSEDVVVTGTPRIVLVVGSTSIAADYIGMSGTNGLIFRYTVQSGQQDMDGIQVTGFTPNASTIRDAAGNNANTALNNVANTTQVRVNTTSPTVTLSAPLTLTNAPFTVTAAFSEAVTGLNASDFAVTNGTADNLQTSDNITYTVTITPAANGAVTVQLPAAAAVNIGDNPTQASNTVSVTADFTAPVVTSVGITPNGFYNEGQTLDFTVTFSEVVNVTTAGGTPYMAVNLTSGVQPAVYSAGSGTNTLTFTYTVVAGDMDMDGITLGAGISLGGGGTITDAAGNNANLVLNGVGNSSGVFVNTSHPTVTISAAAPSLVNAPFTVNITFSEAVTGLTATDFSIAGATISNIQTTNNITYTALVTPGADGNYNLSLPANAVVNIGDNGNQASNTYTFTYDATAPVVTGVAVPVNGYYKAGQTLDFIVRFDDDIIINTTGGNPTLSLTIGTATVNATYTGANGTDGLNFSYTVADGDQDMDGITVGTLALNGATIKDVATNDANLTLNNVGNTSAVRVNTTHPTVALSTNAVSPTNAAYTATVTFSEAVTGFVSGDITVSNATLGAVSTTDNITYTVLVTPTADGAVSLTVPADAAVNIGDNGNSASNTLTLTYDVTAPVVTSVTVPADGYYKATQQLNFIVNFNENITVNTTGGNPTLSLTIGAATVNATYMGTSGTNGITFSYIVQNGQEDMDGITVGTLALNGATIQDAATNDVNLTLNSVGNTANVKVNTTNTTAILSTPATLVNGAFTVTATFGEAVTGLVAGDFVTTNGNVTNLQTADNITYTVTVTPTTDGAATTVNLPASAAVNVGGNPSQASNTLTVNYDATAPVVTTVGVPANGYYKAGDVLTFTVNFSENITVTGTPSLGVTIGTATVAATYTGGTGTNALTYAYTVVNGDQDMNGIEVGTLSLNGGTMKDAAGNNANGTLNSVGATTGVFVNTTHPTVTLSTTAPSLVNAPFTATITFSEAVTGFAAGDITVANATLSAINTTDNITYTVLVTPTADGVVSLNVSADVAVNIGNNGNSASNTLNRTFDGTAPVVTSVSVPLPRYYHAGQALNFTVHYDSDISVNTAGGVPTISLEIGSVMVNATYTGMDGTNGLNFTYTVVNGDEDMNGIIVGTMALNGATIRDAATNDANLILFNTANTSGVRVNTTHPTVAISTTAPALVNVPFNMTVTFSEAVTGFTGADITATNATVGTPATTDNITYTVLVTPTADGAVSLNVPANVAVNIGDNGNSASNTLNLTYDATGPVVTSVTVPADGYYNEGNTLNFSVTFNEDIAVNIPAGNDPTLSIIIGTATVNATYTGKTAANALGFSYTVVDGDQDMDGITIGTLTLNGSTVQDAVNNNANLTLNNVGNTTNVKVSTANPTVTLSTTATLVNAPFTVTAVFSEPVTILTASDFAATNGTVSNVSSTDNITYTATITPTADGAVTVQIPANGVVNTGGNPNLASNTVTVTNDVTAPVVTAVTVPANGYYKAGDVLNFTVNFSENITAATTGGTPYLTVTLSTGTVRAGYTGTAANAVTFSYIVRPGDMDLDGITVGTITLNGGTFQDVATNDADVTLHNIGNTTGVLVHTASPSVQLSTTAASRVNAPFTVTVTFNEAVTGLAIADFTVTNGTAGSLQTADNITYTVVVTPAVDGAVTIQLPTGTVVNVVGNVNTASNILSLTYDVTAPVVTTGLAFETLERSAVGATVGTVTATEVAGTLQNWTIATDDSNGAFAIDANGNITVKDQAKLNAKANSTVTLTVTVSDGLNTSVATPVTVKVLPVNLAPSLDPISDETVCPSDDIHTINLNGASAGEAAQTFSFRISTDKPANFDQLSVSSTSGQVTYQLKPTATGTATVTVTIQDNGGTANGGVDTLRRSFTITVATLGQVDITSDKGNSISKGDVVNLTATGGTIFKWDNATGIISGQNSAVLVVRPMENTTYRVTVSNAAGCSNTAEFTLNVVEDFKVEATNLLTPNGDGVNDKWVIRNLDSYPDNELKIYDRAGRLVYTRRNYANEWDGTLNGSPLGEGTYYYILTIQGGAKTAKGYITIIRDRR